MKDVKEQIKESTCFGVAFEPLVAECKRCELRQLCKTKCEGGEIPDDPTIEVAATTTKSTAKTASNKAKKPESPINKVKQQTEKNVASDPKGAAKANVSSSAPKKSTSGTELPDFKNMSMEDLEKLADERGADPKWKTYENTGIRRMRCTMAIKKTYN
jgi:hypothetical protein